MSRSAFPSSRPAPPGAARPTPSSSPRMAYEPWRDEPVDAARVERPRYRPPVGIPSRETGGARARFFSVALHLLLLAVIVSPWAVPRVLEEIETGAGGPGPAGGGGGGSRGTGGRPDLDAR